MQTIEDVLQRCESSLDILTMNDADLRGYLESSAHSPENLAFMQSSPIEQMRKGIFDSVIGEIDFDLENLLLKGVSELPIK